MLENLFDKKAILLTSIESISWFSEVLNVLRVARENNYKEITTILIGEDRCIKEAKEVSLQGDHAFHSKFKPACHPPLHLCQMVGLHPSWACCPLEM